MALEDFDEAGDELELDLDQLDLSPAAGIDLDDPLNEDLFDFPVMAVFQSLQQAGAEVEAQGLVTEADATSDILAGSLVTDAPAPAAAALPAADYDRDLDEDIFDFDSIFAGGDVVATPAAALEPDAFDAPQAPAAPAQAAPVAAAPAQPRSGARPEPVRAHAAADPDEDDIETFEVPLPSVEVPGAALGRDKLVMLLAVGFLLVNTALIMLAWQANSSFHGTLRDVSRGIAEGLSNGGPAQAAGPGANTGNSVSYVPVETTGHAPRVPRETPSPIQSSGEQTITSARVMLGSGRFLDARRNLNHLLANADLLTLDRELIAEAEFLIAESYELQGNALLEQR